MVKVQFEKVDFYFLIILILGILLRFISLTRVDFALDTYTYVAAAKNILDFDYNSFRAPGFPIFTIPFLFLPQNNILISTPESKIAYILLTKPELMMTAKLGSFTASILLIVCSYYVFRKASLKLLDLKEEKLKTAKYIGLITSFLISFSLPYIINTGRGLREELLALILLIIFYFTIVNDNVNLKSNLGLAISVSYLSLIHLTAGIFIFFGIILFFIVSKLKYFKFKSISIKKVLITILAIGLTLLLWFFFCNYKFGDPFKTLQTQSEFFRDTYGLDLSSFDKIISALINAIIFGIPSEFYILFTYFGFIFTILSLYVLLRNITKKQFLFIFLVVGVNFAYLSIFMAIPGDIRLIMYFFPLLLYLGSIPIGTTVKKLTSKGNTTLLTNISLILFLVLYTIRGIIKEELFLPLFTTLLAEIIYWIFILIGEISLLIYIIKNKDVCEHLITNFK